MQMFSLPLGLGTVNNNTVHFFIPHNNPRNNGYDPLDFFIPKSHTKRRTLVLTLAPRIITLYSNISCIILALDLHNKK